MISELSWNKVDKVKDSLTGVPILEASLNNSRIALLIDPEQGHFVLTVGNDTFTTEVRELVVSAIVAVKPEVATQLTVTAPEEREDEEQN